MTDGNEVVENMDKSVSSDASRKPRDEFWGGFVFATLVFGMIFAIGFFSFLGYRAYERRAGNDTSIADLSKVDFSHIADSEPVKDAGAQEEDPVAETVPVVNAKQSSITVLNGSGTKGAAGVLVEFLKKEGYVKTSAGNADGEYSGTVVFYQEGQESAAKSVLADVVKKYPKATVSKADPGRKETGAAQITVVLGK